MMYMIYVLAPWWNVASDGIIYDVYHVYYIDVIP
jgi:hypothetical protein